jgi:hypothetical protein
MPHLQVRLSRHLSKSFLDLLQIFYSVSRKSYNWLFSNIAQVCKLPLLDLSSFRPLRPNRLNGSVDQGLEIVE